MSKRLLLAAVFTTAVVGGALGLSVTGGLAASSAPQFRPPSALDKYGGGTEPRVTVAPNGKRYVVTNQSDGTAVIWRSDDGGATWKKLPATIPSGATGQVVPTIDTDIVAMHTGRILASELDLTGPRFVTAYSDDEGASWTLSTGNGLVDQDRQWYAVGPDDATTHQPRVYQLSHNLFSGEGNHNMFVATSTDGGATFGPPIPTTLPGDQAYADLQCADSGGPSNIFVNPKTGQIYVVFGTRSAQIAGPINLGGCGASGTGSFQINVVAATKIWVATSMDGSALSWTQSAAVDDSVAGNIVGMQLSPGAVDAAGNVYIGYPESPNVYPDYSKAAVKMVWAPANLGHWSKPATVSPGGGIGHLLVHLVAGDAGKVDFAYFTGIARPGGKQYWLPYAAQTLDALDPSPVFTEVPLSSVATYTLDPSAMMGACGHDPVTNGFLCNRSTDVWGVALDANCNFIVTWPVSGDNTQNDMTSAQGGTYVTTQTGGPTVCVQAASTQAAPTPPAPAAARSMLPPTSTAGSARGLLLVVVAAAVALTAPLSWWRRSASRAGGR